MCLSIKVMLLSKSRKVYVATSVTFDENNFPFKINACFKQVVSKRKRCNNMNLIMFLAFIYPLITVYLIKIQHSQTITNIVAFLSLFQCIEEKLKHYTTKLQPTHLTFSHTTKQHPNKKLHYLASYCRLKTVLSQKTILLPLLVAP